MLSFCVELPDVDIYACWLDLLPRYLGWLYFFIRQLRHFSAINE